jgi:hypothetical protein
MAQIADNNAKPLHNSLLKTGLWKNSPLCKEHQALM